MMFVIVWDLPVPGGPSMTALAPAHAAMIATCWLESASITWYMSVGCSSSSSLEASGTVDARRRLARLDPQELLDQRVIDDRRALGPAGRVEVAIHQQLGEAEQPEMELILDGPPQRRDRSATEPK